jgi:hypothetical protein
VVHPAAGAVAIDDPAPLAVLGDHPQRLAAVHELPVDAVVEAGPTAGVGGLGAHGDGKARSEIGIHL